MPPTPHGAIPTERDGREARDGFDRTDRREWRTSALLLLLCLLVYNANLRCIGAGDTLPARYLPFGIWRYGSVLLNPIQRPTLERHAINHYWITQGRNWNLVSLYPIVVPLAVAPLYAPAVTYLDLRGWTERRLRRVAALMEKLSASLVAAVAVALFYQVLRRRARRWSALLLALAFAFGTDTWMIGSQALWQHGMAELLVVGALYLLSEPCSGRRGAAALGALCALLVANRPPDAILAAALGLHALWWTGPRWRWLLAGGALPLGLLLVYNLGWVGSLFGAYALIPSHAVFNNADWWGGIAGLLVSPARGLFVYSPFLLLVFPAVRRGLRDADPGPRRLTLAIGAAALGQLMLYANTDWRAGMSWGPRFLTDLLPLLVWLLPPALDTLRTPGRTLFAAGVLAAVAIQAIGAFWYIGASDLKLRKIVPGHSPMYAAWNLDNTPFLVELRHNLARPDPAFAFWNRHTGAWGAIDRIAPAGGPPAQPNGGAAPLIAGNPLLVEGWATVDGVPPRELEIDVDGTRVPAQVRFIDRSPAANDPGEPPSSGFRATLPAASIPPGRHLISVAAKGSGQIAPLPVAEQQVNLAPGPGTPPHP